MQENMEYTELGMTNFDHSIDGGFGGILKSKPNEIFGNHAARNFCGDVFWNGKLFCEKVYCYHGLVGEYTADSLRELMETVNEEHGGS